MLNRMGRLPSPSSPHAPQHLLAAVVQPAVLQVGAGQLLQLLVQLLPLWRRCSGGVAPPPARLGHHEGRPRATAPGGAGGVPAGDAQAAGTAADEALEEGSCCGRRGDERKVPCSGLEGVEAARGRPHAEHTHAGGGVHGSCCCCCRGRARAGTRGCCSCRRRRPPAPSRTAVPASGVLGGCAALLMSDWGKEITTKGQTLQLHQLRSLANPVPSTLPTCVGRV